VEKALKLNIPVLQHSFNVDLCGSEPEAGLTEYAVEKLGVGSDASGRDFSVQMGKVLGASIGEEEKERTLSRNGG